MKDGVQGHVAIGLTGGGAHYRPAWFQQSEGTMSIAGSRRDVIDLFNAHLADEEDLRTPVKRATASPRWMSLKRSSPRAAHEKARAVVASPGHRSLASGTGERNLLLVLDESPETKRAVTYVIRVLGRRRGFRVCIAYILPEPHPRFLENGGAGIPRPRNGSRHPSMPNGGNGSPNISRRPDASSTRRTRRFVRRA